MERIRSSRNKKAKKTTKPLMPKVTSAPLSGVGAVSRVFWAA